MATASNNIRGAVWVVGAAFVATIMSSAVHELGAGIHSAQTAFVRGSIGSVLILMFVLMQSDLRFRTERLKLHIVRGLIGVIAINLGFYSITILPLATVTALFFTTPLFVTAFSVKLLGEKVGIRRAAASVTGFCGALIVIGYLPEPISLRWFAPIFASIAFSLVLILGKKLSTTDQPGTIVLYFAIILAIGSLPPALIVWETPTIKEWILLVLVAATSSLRNYMDVRGYALGEAQFVAPFLYSRMIFMAIAGYLIFDQVPTLTAMAGAAVIITSTLYILHREMRVHKRELTPRSEVD